MQEQSLHGRTCKYPLGSSSKDKFSESRVPVPPHDQQIGVAIRHMSFKHVTNATSLGIDFVEYHLDAVSRQVLRQLRTGPPGVDSLFFSHGENAHAFRFLQNRHRVCDGPRGRPTEVPSHTTVSSANDPALFRVCGNTTVGRPEPKMMDSAYH